MQSQFLTFLLLLLLKQAKSEQQFRVRVAFHYNSTFYDGARPGPGPTDGIRAVYNQQENKLTVAGSTGRTNSKDCLAIHSSRLQLRLVLRL